MRDQKIEKIDRKIDATTNCADIIRMDVDTISNAKVTELYKHIRHKIEHYGVELACKDAQHILVILGHYRKTAVIGLLNALYSPIHVETTEHSMTGFMIIACWMALHIRIDLGEFGNYAVIRKLKRDAFAALLSYGLDDIRRKTMTTIVDAKA